MIIYFRKVSILLVKVYFCVLHVRDDLWCVTKNIFNVLNIKILVIVLDRVKML